MKLNQRVFAGAVFLSLASLPFAGPSNKVVTVKIWRVAQVDNLDKGDALGSDKADFYSLVKVGKGELTRSGNFSHDDGHPGWEFYGEGNSRYVPIRIKINDDDGGLEEKDDFVDVNRRKGKKDLNIVFDTMTGRITGDLKGRRGQILYTEGGGDSDKGKLWFSVK